MNTSNYAINFTSNYGFPEEWYQRKLPHRNKKGLIQCIADMGRIVQSWKSYTGKWGLANNAILDLGLDEDATVFWMPDYWDRFIRDEEHFNDTVKYILDNPKKAHLSKDHVAYLFTGITEKLLSSG